MLRLFWSDSVIGTYFIKLKFLLTPVSNFFVIINGISDRFICSLINLSIRFCTFYAKKITTVFNNIFELFIFDFWTKFFSFLILFSNIPRSCKKLNGVPYVVWTAYLMWLQKFEKNVILFTQNNPSPNDCFIFVELIKFILHFLYLTSF